MAPTTPNGGACSTGDFRTRAARERAAGIWRCSARDHATKLVVLILYGNPREDEPLQFAWRRALDHLGFPGIELEDLEDEFRFDDTRERAIAPVPGEDENAKFVQVLRSAPDWLLSFCMVCLDNHLLGLELVSRREPLKLGKLGLRECTRAWPSLPKGTPAAGEAIPDNILSDDCTIEEAISFQEFYKKGEENLDRDERKRFLAISLKLSGAAETTLLLLIEGNADEDCM